MSKSKMPIRYMNKNRKLRVHANNLKGTWALMFNDVVLQESDNADLIIGIVKMAESNPCWVQVKNHYPEDSDKIIGSVKAILGEYHHEIKDFDKDVHSKGDRQVETVKVYFWPAMTSDQGTKILNKVEKIIKESFGPAGKIEVSIEIP